MQANVTNYLLIDSTLSLGKHKVLHILVNLS